MSARPRLIIFDVDGTLVDSQNDIVSAMTHAFTRAEEKVPDRKTILGIVGLSLDVAIARLAPQLPVALQARMVEWYKQAYMQLRASSGAAQSSPLYPYARETLAHFFAQPDVVLGVATGKSRRGLDKLLQGHELQHLFGTEQVSDNHPSKPDPAMLRAALTETGAEPGDAVMIGDTSFDMEMAHAAGIRGIGVSWGYHPRSALSAAYSIVDDFRELPACLNTIWEMAK